MVLIWTFLFSVLLYLVSLVGCTVQRFVSVLFAFRFVMSR